MGGFQDMFVLLSKRVHLAESGHVVQRIIRCTKTSGKMSVRMRLCHQYGSREHIADLAGGGALLS